MARFSDVIDRLLNSSGSNGMPPAVADYVLSLQFDSKDIARYEQLSQRIGRGGIARDQEAELGALARLNNALMLLKAKASMVAARKKPAA